MTDLGSILLLPVGRPAWEDLETLSHDLAAEGAVCTVGRSVPLPQLSYDRTRNQYLANAFLALATQALPGLADPRGKVLEVTEA